ncbi:winged helix-turn-helix transcriptional regulator [Enterococcus casseliflavus]|uniref:winged helix-turn-helix transcriptional regulator n=1 Tax=Enterococcus casseliflavus TaxID=37734 RepID=UPI0018832010|nr:winged helix-turn-helix transcriptional regulator [Enterococcus casseliflavus]MBE9908893.1 winged helix-turn-helix transcriptional regulator [Enterococcus casseliflavus]
MVKYTTEIFYLLSIEYLNKKNTANNKNIAEHLNVSPPSVTEMVMNLKRKNMIKFDGKEILLTMDGENMLEKFRSEFDLKKY